MITIRTFPTHEGDTSTKVALDQVKPNELFKPGVLVVMDGKSYKDWDGLLVDIHTHPDPVEIHQITPITGG